MSNGSVSKATLVRWQEVQNDIEIVEHAIRTRKYGSKGTLGMMRLRQLLKIKAYSLEKGAFYGRSRAIPANH